MGFDDALVVMKAGGRVARVDWVDGDALEIEFGDNAAVAERVVTIGDPPFIWNTAVVADDWVSVAKGPGQ